MKYILSLCCKDYNELKGKLKTCFKKADLVVQWTLTRIKMLFLRFVFSAVSFLTHFYFQMEKAKEKIAAIDRQKEYLEKSLAESEQNIREMVQARP